MGIRLYRWYLVIPCIFDSDLNGCKSHTTYFHNVSALMPKKLNRMIMFILYSPSANPEAFKIYLFDFRVSS